MIWPCSVEVQIDEHVRAPGDRTSRRMCRLHLQRFVERAWGHHVHQNPVYTTRRQKFPTLPVMVSAMIDLARRIAVARGDEPADLVIRGGSVLSVFTREWLQTDVAIVDGFVAGLGDYDAAEVIDAKGRF